MDKMKMETANKTLEKLEILKEMFPEVITETKDVNGEIVSAIDAKKLEQLLSTKVIEGDECYDFTWVGKKQAMVEANRPIRKTLRPSKEESVDWENTENLYIEGDNLDVLKLLQESYLNKIKMIYIDPPYNTGNDSFIYPDDYKTNKDQYDEEVGAIDESGYRMFKNTETNGRFHSSWCSMIYPRLKLARNLLSEDGVIFISIDDHEVDSLKKMCNEVFGESNFVGQWNWFKSATPPNLSKKIKKNIEYILCYQKGKNYEYFSGIKKVSKSDDPIIKPQNTIKDLTFPEKIIHTTLSDGIYKKGIYGTEKYPNELLNDLVVKDGIVQNSAMFRNKFVWTQVKLDEEIKNETRISLSNNLVLSYKKSNYKNETPPNLINEEVNVDTTENAGKDLDKLMEANVFDYPKPVSLLKYLCNFLIKDSDIILDFFSGSATTAHAVMQLNAEDGGKRKFIMVQLPEVCDEKSEAYKAGYQNICEIGKERIRRAGKKIKEETGKQDLDIGFRVLKLDESNMKDVYYTPDKITQASLLDQIDNIKEDRNGYDLLYACMLEWGLELSLPHKVENIDGFEVHIVNDGDLIACFDKNITDDVIKKIAKKKPLRAVFRDNSFATDSKKTNMKEIFKLEFPELDNEGLKRKVRIL